MDTSKLRKRMPVATLLDPKIVMPAIGQAFVKLNPATLIKNPVIFVLEIVTALTTILLVRDLVQHHDGTGFTFQIVLWLWFTVLFANFAEAVAEGRGKAQADTLRRSRVETKAKKLSDETTLSGLLNTCLADWIAEHGRKKLKARLVEEYRSGQQESHRITREFAHVDKEGWPLW